jgi:sugar phosphate isomerase/epimerase
MTPYSRRDFTKLALAAVPAAGLFSLAPTLHAASGRPNSKVRGVQIGLNVPYSFKNPAMDGEEILANCVKLGLSGVELRTQPVEAFLGAPANLVSEKARVVAAAGGADQLRTWRKSAPVENAKDFRKLYENAGVKIEIVKVDGIFKMTDAELDYVFTLAKNLGARALSTEISKVDDDHKRVGGFADKHAMMIGYHGHATTTPAYWEKAFALARHNGANVDLGHFVAGNDSSVVDFIKQHHARITHVHVKDRKSKKNGGANMPFGQGDTPIVEVLRLIRDQKWPIQATIEFEYPIPTGSDRMGEIARSIQFCRAALA